MNLRKGLSVSMFGVVMACISASLIGGSAKEADAAQSPAAKTKVAAGDPHAGQEVFSKNCTPCHSIIEGQTIFGPSLYHETKKADKKTPAQIMTIIEKGKGKMPAWGDKLDPKQKADVVAYVKTL